MSVQKQNMRARMGLKRVNQRQQVLLNNMQKRLSQLTPKKEIKKEEEEEDRVSVILLTPQKYLDCEYNVSAPATIEKREDLILPPPMVKKFEPLPMGKASFIFSARTSKSFALHN